MFGLLGHDSGTRSYSSSHGLGVQGLRVWWFMALGLGFRLCRAWDLGLSLSLGLWNLGLESVPVLGFGVEGAQHGVWGLGD